MFKTIPILLFSTALVLLYGCSQQQQVIKKKEVSPSSPGQRAFDPLDYDSTDSSISFTMQEKPSANTVSGELPEDEYVIINVDKRAWEEEKKRMMSLEETEEHQLGFRIQIFTTTVMGTALSLKDSLNKRFTVNLYLQHDAPYYKLRVGDFLKREDADSMLEKIIAYGYKEAWIVRSEICYACAKWRKKFAIVPDSTDVLGD